MSEPRKSCGICKDHIEEFQTWTVDENGKVHNECHIKQKLIKSNNQLTHLKSELEKCRVELDSAWSAHGEVLGQLRTSEQRVKDLLVALEQCDCLCKVSEISTGKLCIRCSTLSTLHKAIGDK